MATTVLTLDVRNLPEVIFEIRKQMADVLRAEAESTDDISLARKLHEIAADFEVDCE